MSAWYGSAILGERATSYGGRGYKKEAAIFCVSPTIHVLWPNLSKIGCCEVAEKSSGIAYKKRTLLSSHFAHTAYRAQNFGNIADP